MYLSSRARSSVESHSAEAEGSQVGSVHERYCRVREDYGRRKRICSGGEYCCSGDDWRNSMYVLVEYSATLPRAARLRKRVR